MNSGPGLKPHSTSAASRIAVVPEPGNAEREQRHQRAAGLGVVGALRRGHALDHAGAELLAAPRHRLLDAVGDERGDGRARRRAARRSRKPTTEPLAKAKRQSFRSCQRRQEVAQALRHRQQLRCLARLHVGEHLAEGEHADRDDDEVDAREQLHAAEGEARGGC